MNGLVERIGRGALRSLFLVVMAAGVAACNDDSHPGTVTSVATAAAAADVTGSSDIADDSADTAASTSSNASASNKAPTITGTPKTATKIGEAYSFTPSATDADSKDLGFTIQNKPTWASFSTSTGKLSGTPTLAHVGTYKDIVVTVSDGTTSKSLKAFTITVAQQSTNAATLSWLPPTENVDGTSVANLAGYYVYYSQSADAQGGEKVVLSNAGLTSYVVENLGKGKWYFAIKAYTVEGTESALSAVASKTVT